MTRNYFLYTLISFLSVLSVYGQKTKSINLEKSTDFINSTIVKDTLKFNLSSKTGLGIFSEDTTLIFEDSIFDVEDKAFIRLQINQMKNKKWQNGQIDGSKVISKKKIKRIFRKLDGWHTFRKIYGNCLTSYSIPLFNKNYNYCIFYNWTQCDYLAGDGSLDLYKFINGKWTFVKSYVSGES